jgi:hypothetical protein
MNASSRVSVYGNSAFEQENSSSLRSFIRYSISKMKNVPSISEDILISSACHAINENFFHHYTLKSKTIFFTFATMLDITTFSYSHEQKRNILFTPRIFS